MNIAGLKRGKFTSYLLITTTALLMTVTSADAKRIVTRLTENNLIASVDANGNLFDGRTLAPNTKFVEFTRLGILIQRKNGTPSNMSGKRQVFRNDVSVFGSTIGPNLGLVPYTRTRDIFGRPNEMGNSRYRFLGVHNPKKTPLND